MSDPFEEFELPEPKPMEIGAAGDLDQADIDALFGDIGGPAPTKSGLRAVVESDIVNHERLPMLEVICDRVIRSFATNMRNLTSDAIDVTLEEVTGTRFGEIMNRVALPAMFGVFKVREWENFGIMVVEPSLIYSVVDALLGGRKGAGQQMRVEGRAFTTIETALVARMMQLALNDLAHAFEQVAQISIDLERIESSPRFAAVAGPSNVTAVCTFRVEMEGRGGKFSFLLPHTTLEPVRDKLLQRFMGEKSGRDGIWETHMDRELRKTELSLRAVLSERMMKLQDVRDLQIGETLPLNKHPDDPLEIHCSGIKLGMAQLGQRNNSIAVRMLTDIARN
jgi:flagellar motor switch protein FliM